MKRIALSVALSLLALSAFAQTELYTRYANQQGVRVASVTNFAIDSSSRIDVTLIEAIDSEGWTWMKREFQIGELASGQEATLSKGNDVVLFARRSRSDPSQAAPIVEGEVDLRGSCFMGISYLEQAVYLFCADSEEQSNAVASLLVKKMMMHQSVNK